MAESAVRLAVDGTLILERPTPLPDVLDLLIVGGGPFGTATAFRAKELDLSALVIDYDDLMKRIRDYAKDKLILPDYGGGDLMQFPDGGELIRSLHFGPIDKDEMCRQWKSLYRRFNVPAMVGVEMTGLTRDKDLWRVVTWNHNTRCEQSFLAHHVVLAFGRGVPRRLDIPGNVEGLAFSLTDPSAYLGRPACVIGGGTSAAEAVIAISNAKSASSDPSPVYWSYRGEKLPKVSKALAEVFFEAFVGNGNVRYLPKSEPVAFIEADGEPRLTLRTARVCVEHAPPETTQLEFGKSFCVACIGEDIPKAMLEKIGIPLVAGGPANKERIVVTPVMETRQPNVYLAGDVLSPAYFETRDLDGDPAQFGEVKRRGNIKAALRDGVAVAEVIAQKLAGRQMVEVNITFSEVAVGPATMAMSRADLASVVPPALTSPCRLVALMPTGLDADEYPIRQGAVTTIGREGADIRFPDDSALSDVHAEIRPDGEGFVIADKGGMQGVFLQPEPNRAVAVELGTIVRAGRQWLVVGSSRSPASLLHYDATGKRIGTHELKQGLTIVGRQSPDITLATTDWLVSRRHLVFTLNSAELTIKDIGSANGTQIKVRKPLRLVGGDRILVGRQVLRFDDERSKSVPSSIIRFNVSRRPTTQDIVAGPAKSSVAEVAAPVVVTGAGAVAVVVPVVAAGVSALPVAAAMLVTPPRPADPPAPDNAAGEPSVRFEGIDRLVMAAKGQTICQVAEGAGIALRASCHQGLCGEDPIRLVAGGEHLNAIGSNERDTLEDLCSLEPGTYRLACMARVTGPVVVQIVKQQ